MALSNKERQQRFRDKRRQLSPTDYILARVKEVLKSAPKSYQERLTKVLNKFDDERSDRGPTVV